MKKTGKPFKLIVAGSRNFFNYEVLKNKLDMLLANVKDEIIIISGTAGGADKLGERYAEERGYKVDRYPAPWNDIEGKPAREIGVRKDGSKYWKKAGPFRNEQMACVADACVVFRVNNSSGSTDMYTRATDHKLLVRIFDF